MKFIEAPLAGVYSIELEPVIDERGFFERMFCQKEFAAIGFHKHIVQINHSMTRNKGAVRGMHYQSPPACETKIIKCIGGKVFDVMVDIRADSPTFLQWHGMELSENNMRMVLIPEGFAHGFQSLTDDAELLYFVTAFYSPEFEGGLRFNDPVLAIDWPLSVGAVSSKDSNWPLMDRCFKGIAT